MITRIAFIRSLTTLISAAIATYAHCQSGYLTNEGVYDIVSDSAGFYVQNHNFHIDNLFPKNQWKGDWIWLNQPKFKEYQETKTNWGKSSRYAEQYKALFRKSFLLKEIPAQVIMSITADVSFRIYINGTFAARGPANTGNDYFDGVPPKHWFFNTHNIKRFLHPGTNTLAVEVFSHFREISETSSGQGMLICDLDTGLNKNIVATDSSWKCAIDTSFMVNRGNFFCNSELETSNWFSQSYDDSAWENASRVNFQKEEYLTISKIPVPFSCPVNPVRVRLIKNDRALSDVSSLIYNKKLSNEEFTLDYGRNMTAYYGFKAIANKNDTVKIYPCEKNNASQNRALIFVCKEGINAFHAPYLSVFRYLKIEVKSPKGLIIKSIDTDFSSYPVNYTGSFSCSDQSLTELWNVTRWTTQLCMNDMFYDSPRHQEPIACTGDYFIQSLVNYFAFGDPWLARQTLVKTALLLEKNNYDMFHTSYSLLWIQMLHQYYRYTGDIRLVKELLPHVNKLNQLFESYLDQDYLVSDAPDYMFMDWIQIDKYNAHHPPAVIGMGYMTAFYYKSLLDAAFLNELADNIPVRDKNLKLAEKVKAGINKSLWDRKKNLYKDGLPFRNRKENHDFFPEDADIVTYSPHLNTLAVLYDLASDKKKSAILKYIANQKSIEIQPYFMFFVLSACDHAGKFNTLGLDLLKKWENGMDEETYTLKEIWQDKTESGYNGDYSHAWGGSPLYFLSKNILGVNSVIPGGKKIEIVPFESENIHWAEGRIPFTLGNNMAIRWEKISANKYIYTLEIPEGSEVFMVIPEDLRRNNFKINNLNYSGATDRVQLFSGIHEIEYGRK